jgi:hypothetical protein
MNAATTQLRMFGRVGLRRPKIGDPCAGRSRGNPESAAAFSPTHAVIMRERVYAFIRAAGAKGATLDETSDAFGIAPNRISGRVTALRVEGRILRTADRRETRTGALASVYIAVGER